VETKNQIRQVSTPGRFLQDSLVLWAKKASQKTTQMASLHSSVKENCMAIMKASEQVTLLYSCLIWIWAHSAHSSAGHTWHL